MDAFSRTVRRPRLDMELNIGNLEIILRFEEAGGKRSGHSHGSGSEEDVAKGDESLSREGTDFVIESGSVAFMDKACLQVVLKVLSNAWEVMYEGNIVLLKQVCVCDSREHEDVWGTDGSSGEDDFAPSANDFACIVGSDNFDPDGPFIFDNDSGGGGLCEYGKIFSIFDGVEVSDGGTATFSIVCGEVEESDAFLRSAVIVVIEGVSASLSGFEPSVTDVATDSGVRDFERPLCVMEF